MRRHIRPSGRSLSAACRLPLPPTDEITSATWNPPDVTAIIARGAFEPLADGGDLAKRGTPGGCDDPLARFDGGQARNGRCGLRHRLDDFRPGGTRDPPCRLGLLDA